jgi:hypothetical protein
MLTISKNQVDNDAPFVRQYHACMDAIKSEGLHGVYASWMMAITFKCTMFNAFWDVNDLMYRPAVNALPFSLYVERRDFVNTITVKDGHNANRIPRFAFNAQAHYVTSQDAYFQSLTAFDKVLMACNLGQAGILGMTYMPELKPDDRAVFIHRYLASPELQLRVLAKELKQLSYVHRGDVGKMFSAYFQVPGSNYLSEAGPIAYGLNFGFSEALIKRDLPLTLDG